MDIQFVWSLPNEVQFYTLTPDPEGSLRVLIGAYDPAQPPVIVQGHQKAIHLSDQLFKDHPALRYNGNATTEAEYLNGAQSAVREIRDSALDKVVLSTTTFVNATPEPEKLLDHLRTSHPNAFVYYFYHPNYGSWVGATPEPLIRGAAGKYSTVSLAGTRLKEQGVVPWGQKEALEQSIVTDFILERLSRTGASNIRISRPETLPYGNIEHLCSVIRFESDDIRPIIEALHPTPAVCGTPLELALPLIQKTEKHERSLYTGYIGLIDSKQEAHVFVNLRCMQLFENGLLVYTGGGLTLESDPIDEWRETRNKLKALLNEYVPINA